MQVDDLRNQVRRAFAKVSYPSTVGEMVAAPYSGGSDDPFEMAAAFHGKAWADVPISDLFLHREMIFAMSPAAFVAYLPAYLLATLETEDPYDKYGGDLRFYLLTAFGATSDKSDTREKTTAARLAALSKPQREATMEVLRFLHERWSMRETQDALHALRTLG